MGEVSVPTTTNPTTTKSTTNNNNHNTNKVDDDDDIVGINVGGKLYLQVLRSTLCLPPINTRWTQMFSRRSSHNQCRKEEKEDYWASFSTSSTFRFGSENGSDMTATTTTTTTFD